MKIKALFLDFYGTLVYEDGEIIREISEIIRCESPCNPEIKEIDRFWGNKFTSICRENFGENFKLQRDIELESLRETFQKFDCCINVDDISEELFRYWAKQPVFEDSKKFLENVNMPVCILSNIDRADILSSINYHSFKVENIITSEDVRSYKPRPEMFLAALELMKVQPGEVLHIGDSLSLDVTGAQGVGIKTYWLNRNNKNNPGKVKADMECRCLLEVLEYLKENLY